MTDDKPTDILDGIPPPSKQREAVEPAHVISADRESAGPRIFKNIVTLIGGQGFNLVLSGFSTILLARYLGTLRLGEFGAVYAYLGLYSWLTTFGLETILTRQVARDRERAGSILLTGVLVSSLFTLGALAIALAAAPLFGYDRTMRSLLLIGAVDILLLAPLRLPGIIFQVDLRQWYSVSIGLIRQFVWLGVLAALAYAGAGLSTIILGRTFTALLEVALILLATYHKGFLARPWRMLPEEAMGFLRYGFPVAVSTLAVGIYHRIDQVMLHKMVNDQELGNYVATVRLAELVNLLPVAVMASLFPILSRTAMADDQFRQYLRLSFRSLMAMAFAGCMFATLFAGPIVHLTYGVKFSSGAAILAVLIWSEVPIFFGVVMANGLVAKNLQNYLPLATGVGAMVNVGLNLFLIPRWGAMGAAWATNISYTLAGMLIYLLFQQTRSLAWLGFRVVLPPCLLAVFIIAVLRTSPLAVLPRFVAALGLCGLGGWLLGIVRKSDVDQLTRLIGSNVGFLKTNAT